jgi:hypothetical protein
LNTSKESSDDFLSHRETAEKWLAADTARIQKERELGDLQEINRDKALQAPGKGSSARL